MSKLRRLFQDKVTIARLRQEAPAWTWTPYRSGLGWAYRGTLHRHVVEVQAYAGTAGGDDDFITTWMVTPYNEGKPCGESASWDDWVQRINAQKRG